MEASETCLKLAVLFPTVSPPQKGRLFPQASAHVPIDFVVPSISTKEIVCSLPNGFTLAVISLKLGRPITHVDSFESILELSNKKKQLLFGGNQPFWACSYPDSFGADYKTQKSLASALGESTEPQLRQISNAIFGQLLREEAARVGTKEDLSQTPQPARLKEFLNEWSDVQGQPSTMSPFVSKSPAALCYYALFIGGASLPQDFTPISTEAPFKMGQWLFEFMENMSPSLTQKANPNLLNGFSYLIENQLQTGSGKLLLGIANLAVDFLKTDPRNQLKKKIQALMAAPIFQAAFESNGVISQKVEKIVSKRKIERSFLIFILEKVKWLSHTTKKALVKEFNESMAPEKKVLYDYTTEGKVIPLERLQYELGSILSYSLGEGIQFITDNLVISSNNHKLVQWALLRGITTILHGDLSKLRDVLQVMASPKVPVLFKECRIFEENDFFHLFTNCLYNWIIWDFRFKQVDLFASTALNFLSDDPRAEGLNKNDIVNFFDLIPMLTPIGRALKPRDPSNIMAMITEPPRKMPSPTGGLGVLFLLFQGFPSKAARIHEEFKRIYQAADRMRFSDALPFWNLVFEKIRKENIPLLQEHMLVLAKECVNELSVMNGPNFIKRAHPSLQEPLFKLFFEKIIVRKELTLFSFFDYLWVLTMSRQGKKGIERDIGLDVMQGLLQIDKTIKGVSVKEKFSLSFTTQKRIEINFDQGEIRDQILYRNREMDWVKVAYKLLKWKMVEKKTLPQSVEVLLGAITKSVLTIFENLDESDLISLDLCKTAGKSSSFRQGGFDSDDKWELERLDEALEESRVGDNEEALIKMRESRKKMKQEQAEKEEKEKLEKENRKKAPLFYLKQVLLMTSNLNAEKKIEEAKKQLEQFKMEFDTVQETSMFFNEELRISLRKDLVSIEKGIKSTPVHKLKMTPVLQRMWTDIKDKRHLLQSVLFRQFLRETMEVSKLSNDTKSLPKAIEEALLRTAGLVVKEQDKKTLGIYINGLGLNERPVIDDWEVEATLLCEEFKKVKEFNKENIREFVLWISRLGEMQIISQICESLHVITSRIYNKPNEFLTLFVKSSSKPLLSCKANLHKVWDMFHEYGTITKEGLRLLGRMELEIRLLRSTSEKVLNDVSEFLRDPSQVAVFGNRCQVSDVSMMQALKERDATLSKNSNKAERFTEILLGVFVKFIEDNSLFCDHAKRFGTKEEVENLKTIFDNVGDQSKLISSTVRTILLPENKARIILEAHEHNGELFLNMTIQATSVKGDEFKYTMRDLDEYYQILNLHLENSTSADTANQKANKLFFEVFDDIKRIEEILRQLFENSYDVLSEIQTHSVIPVVTATGMSAVYSERKLFEQTYSQWKEKHEVLCGDHPFLEQFTRSELPLIVRAIEREQMTSKVQQLFELIRMTRGLDLSQLGREVKGCKTYLRKVETIAEKISRQIDFGPKLALKRSLSREEKTRISLQFCKVRNSRVLEALYSTISKENNGKMEKVSHLLILNNFTHLSFVDAFFSKLTKEPSGFFLAVIPKSPATTPNSALIKKFSHCMGEASLTLNTSNKRMAVIHHSEIDSGNLMESGYISKGEYGEEELNDEHLVAPFFIQNFTDEKEGKSELARAFVSKGSGDGKTFQIQKQLPSYPPTHKGPKAGYYEIVIGGHTDFSVWISRILSLIPSNPEPGSILNIVIGLPETTEQLEVIDDFYTQVGLFCANLIAFRWYRAPQAFIHLPKNLNLYIEVSNAPANLVQKHLELLKYLEVVEVEPFNFEHLDINSYHIGKLGWSPNSQGVLNSKLVHLIYATLLVDNGTLNKTGKIMFPCPAARIHLKEPMRKPLLKKYIFDVIKAQEDSFGRINYRNFLQTMNMMFLEFVSFNMTCDTLMKKAHENIQIVSSHLKDSARFDSCALFMEMIRFCITYTGSSAAKFIQAQRQVLESAKEREMESDTTEMMQEYMSGLFDDKNVIRFESLNLCLIYFSKEHFHLVFKDSEFFKGKENARLMHSYIMQTLLHPLNVERPEEEEKNEKKLLEFYLNEVHYGRECSEEKLQEVRNRIFKAVGSEEDFLWEMLRRIMDINYDEIERIRRESTFVLTCDGLLKIIIIIKKLRARFPIILMGETGTGKTYLVKFMTKYILKHVYSNQQMKNISGLCYQDIKMEYELIHAGFSEIQIAALVERHVDAANALGQNFLKLVFIDEFNTASAVDLISTVLTKGEIFGKQLPDNLVFIGACNPFQLRKISEKQKSDEEMSALVHPKGGSKLTYSVNPLTEAQLGVLMDFGRMVLHQEVMYSEAIIRHKFGKQMANEDLSLLIRAVTFSQGFARKHEGESSMSIRDIKKFIKAYEWILSSYVPARRNFLLLKSGSRKIDEASLSLTLALWLVYYLRIITNTRRKEYMAKLETHLHKHLYFEDVVREEQRSLLDSLELEDGISKNTPLMENVLSLFICFNAKLPILICGKPGCSKTLAISILNENMRGHLSKSAFLKSFPRIILTYYQGSMSSRSEGVISAFENSERIAKSHMENEMVEKGKQVKSKFHVVLVFDELGLAELSPYNPLKVLHGYLDDEYSECGFVGISNWGLDAAKNNRAVFVARPDLSVDDLRLTAQNISETYKPEFAKEHLRLWNALADTYHEFILEQGKKLGNRVFHGPRDFYSLIKSISSHFKNKEGMNQGLKAKIVQLKVFRNFGGLEGSAAGFYERLRRHMPELPDAKPTLVDILKDYILTEPFRYVMAIGSGGEYHSLQLITQRILKEKGEGYSSASIGSGNSQVHTLSGLPSNLTPDEAERRVSEDLNLIQQYLMRGDLIILNNYPEVYTSLYELFNMKRRKVQDKIFCEIAHSSKTNRYVEINPNAKLIVLVDQANVENEQAPFLNRFEKFVINFDDAMEPQEIELAKETTEAISSLYWKEETPFLPFTRVFPMVWLEFIKGSLIRIKSRGKNGQGDYANSLMSKETMKKALVRKIARTFPTESLFHLQLSSESSSCPVPHSLIMDIQNSMMGSSLKYGSLDRLADYMRKRNATTRVVCFSYEWKETRVSLLESREWVTRLSLSGLRGRDSAEIKSDTLKLVTLSSEEELSAVGQLDRIDRENLKVLVLVPLKRSNKPFEQGLLRACLPTNGWKVLFMDSDEAKVKELVEIVGIKEKGTARVRLTQRESYLLQSLTKNMLLMGVSLDLDHKSTNYKQRIGELESALKKSIEDPRLNRDIIDGIQSASLSQQLLLSRQKSVQSQSGHNETLSNDWRIRAICSKGIDVCTKSVWEVAQGSVEQLVLNQEVYKVLRMQIHFGIPQSLNKLDELGDKALSNDVFNAFVAQESEKPEPPKKGNLHYSYYLPVVWKKIEEVFKKYEKIRIVSKDFMTALNGDEKTRIALRNKHISADELLKLPSSIITNSSEIVKLFKEDVVQFYFQKLPVLATQEGQQRVQILLENNPFRLNSTKEEALTHSSDFIALFYAKDILIEQTLLSQEFGIISKKLIFTEKRILGSVLDALANNRLEYETRQLCRAYKRAKELMQATRVVRTSFIWEITDIIFSVYDSLAFKTSNEPIIHFDRAVSEIGRNLQSNKTSLKELIDAVLSIPVSHPVTLRKGVNQVMRLSKRSRKEVQEIAEAILNLTFSTIEHAGALVNTAFEIFEDYSNQILSLSNLPKFFERIKFGGKNKEEKDELSQTYRAIILHFLQTKMKHVLEDRVDDPEYALVYVYQNYTGSPDFFSNYYSEKRQPIKFIYQVIIRAHTHFLSLLLTDIANKKRPLQVENLRKFVDYALQNKETEVEKKEFYEFIQKGLIRKAIRNGTSLSAMNRVGMDSGIQFQLLIGNLKSQFMYSIRPTASKETSKKIEKSLVDSFFGAKSFGTTLKGFKVDSNLMRMLLLQVYLNQYVMHNDADTKLVHDLVGKLQKSLDSIDTAVLTDFQKRLAKEYISNMPSLPSLQLNANNSPQRVLRNLCILSMVNLVASCQNGIHNIFFNEKGVLRLPSEIEDLFVPGSFTQLIMNYLYMLDLPVVWRNYDTPYTNVNHLLLECKRCGNLNPMFACNNPERIVQCNPPTCKEPVDFNYVKTNHIDNIYEELPRRIKQKLPSHQGMMIFNMAESKKKTLVGKVPMLAIKVIHLIYWSFLSVAVEFDSHYKEYVKKIFELEKYDMGLLRERLNSRIDVYFQGIRSDIKCQESDEFIWMSGVVMEMLDGDKKMPAKFNSFAERESFELGVTAIINKFCEIEEIPNTNSSSEKSDYAIKNWKNGFKNENASEEVLRVVEDSQVDKESQIYQALTQSIEIEEIQVSNIQAKILDDNKRAPFTVMVFSKEEDYKSLVYLKPMVDFYLKMINKYRLQINTREANTKTIEEYIVLGEKDSRWSQLKEDFEELKRLWEEANLHDIHLGCKYLSRKQFSTKDKMAYLFPVLLEGAGATEEERRKGLYIPAAVQTLISYHNEAINQAVDQYDYLAKEILSPYYTEEVTLEELTASDVLMVKDSFSDFVRSYTQVSLSFAGYKLQLKASCDYAAMDRDLMESVVAGKRRIVQSESNFPVFAFSGAMFAQLDILLGFLNDSVKQVPLMRTEDLEEELSRKEESHGTIENLRRELEQIIIIVKETKSADGSMPIATFAEQYENGEFLKFEEVKKRTVFMLEPKYQMKNLKRVYDVIESIQLDAFIAANPEDLSIKKYMGKIEGESEMGKDLLMAKKETRRDLKVAVSTAICRSILTKNDLDVSWLSADFSAFYDSLLDYACEISPEEDSAMNRRSFELNQLIQKKEIANVTLGSCVSFYQIICQSLR